jgi:O-antigen ligase
MHSTPKFTDNPSPRSWLEGAAVVGLFAAAVGAPTSVAAANVLTGLFLVLSLAALLPRPARRLRHVPRSVLAGLVLVLASHALAAALTPTGVTRWDMWAEESWMKLLLVAVPVLIAGRARRVGRALDLLLFVASLVAIYGIVQRYTGVDLTRDRLTDPAEGRFMAEGFFQHHLSYGGNVLITLMLAIARALPRDGRWSVGARLATVASILMATALLFSFARSAQLGAMAGMVALTICHRGRLRRWGLVMIVGLSATVGALPMIRLRFLRVLQGGEETRLNLWQSSWDGIQAHPWFGWGQGHFSEMLAAHEVAGFYNSRSHSHNDYLMHGVNAGLIGLAAQLILIAAVIAVLWHCRDRAGDSGWILKGAFGATVGIAVAGFFQVFQTDDEVEFLFYFVLGCALAVVASFLATGEVFPPRELARHESAPPTAKNANN